MQVFFFGRFNSVLPFPLRHRYHPFMSPAPGPDSADAWYQQGAESYKNGRHTEALVAFAQALARDPKLYRALVYQGLSHLQLGGLDDARQALEAAAQLAPGYAKAHNALGNVHRRLGDMDLAIQSFRRASELDGRSAEYAYNLGITHLDLAQVPEAIDAFKKAAGAAPRDPDIANDLAAAYTRYKAYGDAVRVLEDYLRRCPDTDRAGEMQVRLKKLKDRIAQEQAGA